MTRDRVADVDAFLIAMDCPPHARPAVLALRDHIATCGPARWRGRDASKFWSLTAAVGGHVICDVTLWKPTPEVYVTLRDTEPGRGARAILTYHFSEARKPVLLDSLDAATALCPRLTQAYALALARPYGAAPPPASA